MECRIRRAQVEDAAPVAGLCGQLGYPASVQEIGERLERIGRDDRQAVYVAEGSPGEVVGCIHVSAHSPLVADVHAEIEALIVDGACRSLGIGRLLVERAEQWARQRDCRTIDVRSNVVRQSAHGFYEALGYRRVKTQHTFHQTLASTCSER